MVKCLHIVKQKSVQEVIGTMKTRRRGFIGGLAATAGLMPFAGFPAVVKLRNPNSLLSHACVGTANMAREDLLGL